MSLGSAVHEVLESLSNLKVDKRFEEPLIPKFEIVWEKFTGRLGGFFDVETEFTYKNRGMEMLRRVESNPGPLANLAVKIKMDLPYYWLSEEDNILLCGKIDWLEYLKEEDAVKIIDFKTSRSEEKADSLQLPIYYLLASNCQSKKVVGASYLYLETGQLSQKDLSDPQIAEKKILKIAREIKLARKLEKLSCPHGGCRYCEPLEKVYRGEAEFVGINSFGQDCFVLPREDAESRIGEIL